MNQLGTFIQVMTEKEAVKEGMEISGGIRFCKVEKIQGSYVGSLYIPSRAKNRSHTGLYFRKEKDKNKNVHDSGKVLEWLKEMLKAGDEKQPELGIFFADFLEYLIKDDVISGRQICMILLEQNLIDISEEEQKLFMDIFCRIYRNLADMK